MKDIALLIVDVQNALVDDKPFNIDRILMNIKKLLDVCRSNKIEVIYVQHDGEKEDNLEPFSKGWDIHKSISPKQGEKIIRKTYNSSFKNTYLEEYLNSKNIKELLLVGMQTEYCIDTTCRVAFEKGYKLIMPEDTNTTFDNGDLSAKEVYQYHNFRIFKNRFAKVENIDRIIQEISNYSKELL
ncbi:cysteine hydrolase family protein [Clostridium pasteurianum]|uniref:Nicotinamidase-like amidase n=1 Tax=Clostridium pasteurianum BC1 TaxID=86416 RepID=R4K6K5_CLOPA|nr:cysteine hydrolase family protein [Clostridium pasteurianum]AGK96134.1 nicotinamidase-like amidase [Clostridium pasteurianum BC1]